MPFLSPYLTPIVLQIGSNVFMTTAWYWHLRYKDVPIVYVIFISWSLALITFVVFAGFSYLYLQEPITLSQGFGFALIATGAFFVFHTW
ncbi:MAG: DMT family protein [Pseudolabrys sp.]